MYSTVWFERRGEARSCGGQATLVRYADDFVIGFEYEDDAQRVMDAPGNGSGAFGLTLHPDKTRLVPFRRPPKRKQSGKGPGHLRLPGIHVLLGANPEGSLEDVVQDTECEPETVHRIRLRLVSSPSTPSGRDPARRAQETYPGVTSTTSVSTATTRSLAGPRRASGARLVQVALPSEPANASHVGAVRKISSRLPASQPRIVVRIWGS